MDTRFRDNNSLPLRLLDRIDQFLAAVPGALKDHLNAEELARISIAALTAGGGLYGVLQAVTLHVGTIFPAPSDAAFAAAVLTLIMEAYRRLGHGEVSADTPRRPYSGR